MAPTEQQHNRLIEITNDKRMQSEEIIVRSRTLKHWKENAKEDYIGTPISVLKYITALEEVIRLIHNPPKK